MAKITVGIMYDFDKTLCTTDMQNYGFIKDLGMEPEEFWSYASQNTKKHSMDKILSYMFMMVQKAKEKGIPLTEEYLKSLGETVVLYRGVLTWFDRINAFAEAVGVNLEHYVISSGVKEIIEGTPIAKYFKKFMAVNSYMILRRRKQSGLLWQSTIPRKPNTSFESVREP